MRLWAKGRALGDALIEMTADHEHAETLVEPGREFKILRHFPLKPARLAVGGDGLRGQAALAAV